jgi:sugar phosphate permease
MAAQASFSTIAIGLPVIAPALRDEFDLSLREIGVALAAEGIGLTVTLLAWGYLVDRIGERLVLGVGLTACAAFLCAAAFAPSFSLLLLLLALAGAAGGSVQSSSGRAVIGWFAEDERGLALGIRQTAVPLGGVIAAVVMPPAVAAGGIELAFLVLAGLCLAGAIAGAIVIREGGAAEPELEDVPQTLRNPRLWLLCWGSGLYLSAQLAILGFVVLFLVDVRGFSSGEAAAVLAAVQIVGAALRIVVGRWSDALRSRVVPLRRIGVAAAATVAFVSVVLDAPVVVLVPALVAAGGLSMAWNGLSFTAAAELAGRHRAGAAIGLQQTVLAIIAIFVPVAFAATVAATSWRAAFGLAALGPLTGWFLLAPLADARETRPRRV